MAVGLCCNFQEETCWRQQSADHNNASLNDGSAKTSCTARRNRLWSALKQGWGLMEFRPWRHAPNLPPGVFLESYWAAQLVASWLPPAKWERNLLPSHIHMSKQPYISQCIFFFPSIGILMLPHETLSLVQCLTCSPPLPLSLPPRQPVLEISSWVNNSYLKVKLRNRDGFGPWISTKHVCCAPSLEGIYLKQDG